MNKAVNKIFYILYIVQSCYRNGYEIQGQNYVVRCKVAGKGIVSMAKLQEFYVGYKMV